MAYLSSTIQFLRTLQDYNLRWNLQTWIEDEIIPLLQQWLELVGDSKPEKYPEVPEELLDFLIDLPEKQIDCLQTKLMLPIKEFRVKQFHQEVLPTLSHVEQQAFALLEAGNGQWLTAMPIGEGAFSDDVFQLTMRLWLRKSIPQLESLPVKICQSRPDKKGKMKKKCNCPIDTKGDHLMTCNQLWGNYRLFMHNKILHWLAKVEYQARISAEIEPRKQFVAEQAIEKPNGTAKTERRLLDLYSGDAHITANGKDTLSDVAGKHGVCAGTYKQHRAAASKTLEQILSERVKRKREKYTNPVAELGYNFKPLVFETIGGGCDQELEEHIKLRSVLIAERTGLDAGTVKYKLMRDFSCLVRKSMASTIRYGIEQLVSRSYPALQNADIYNDYTIRPITKSYLERDE